MVVKKVHSNLHLLKCYLIPLSLKGSLMKWLEEIDSCFNKLLVLISENVGSSIRCP
jgi:hypothetical protein